MATELSAVRAFVKKFNDKYKVNYDLDDYMTRMRTEDSDTLYIGTFNKMLDQAIEHMSELKDFTVSHMLEDYNYYTMSYLNMYINSHPDLDPPLNVIRLKKTPDGYLKDVNEYLDKKVWGKVDAVGQKYEAREIRIRDMVRESKELDNLQGTAKENAAKKIAGYALALKRVNESHPMWWRIIHPFRNNAEQREARNFEKLLNENLSLDGNFNTYKEYFKSVNPVIYKIKNQIYAKANGRGEYDNYRINPVPVKDDKKPKAVDSVNNNKTNLKDIKKEEIKQEIDQGDIKQDEIITASEKFVNGLRNENKTLVNDLAGEVKDAVKKFAEDNFNSGIEDQTYAFSEQISDSLIEEGVKDLRSKALDICKQYDSFKSNNISKEKLDISVKENLYEMFHIMIEGLDGTNIPLKDKIVISQKTIDKFLNKTTPTSYDSETLGEFADNYLLKKDNEFLENKFGKDTETREAIKGACETIGIRVKIEGINLNEDSVSEVAEHIDNATQVVKDLNSNNVI